MSRLDSILGLPDLSIEEVKRGQHIEVWCKPKNRPACIYCDHDPIRIKSTHHRILKHTRQGNQLMVLHLALPKYHCPECNRYFRRKRSADTSTQKRLIGIRLFLQW